MNPQKRAIAISASVRTMLAAVKFALAWLSGSIALAADALHTFCDVFITMAILICLFLAQVRSRRFPHGLHKIEDLVSLFVSFAIVYVGYEIVSDALLGAAHSTLTRPTVALFAALFSAAVMLALAWYEKRVGRITGSPGVKADAEHNRVDVFASLVVAMGLFGEIGGVHLEWAAALLVGILVFAVGGKIFLDAVVVLLDGNLDANTLETARSIVLAYPGVTSAKAIYGRSSGNTRILQLVVGIRAVELGTAHRICDELEKKLQEEIPNLRQVLIHYEPEHEDAANQQAGHRQMEDAGHRLSIA